MSNPVPAQKHYLATLTRDGEIEPFELKWIDAEDQPKAESLAWEWAIPLLSTGLKENTRLQLVLNGISVYVKEWGGP